MRSEKVKIEAFGGVAGNESFVSNSKVLSTPQEK